MDGSLIFNEARGRPSLEGVSVFVSASIPNPERWDGEADPLEITDAVVSLARIFLTAGVGLVSAAHPTIAPLLLYVAAELPAEHGERIAVYQSQLFEDVLPPATRRFEADGIGRVTWTEAAPGEHPEPGSWSQSLDIMRRQMLSETKPGAAVFIGGMEGILDEFKLFNEMYPERLTYPIGRPGGEAQRLAREYDSPLSPEVMEGDVYPALWRSVLDDMEARR